jgi:fumarylacetoacetase
MPALGVAIGDRLVDLDLLVHSGALGDDETTDLFDAIVHDGAPEELFEQPELWRGIRARVQGFLKEGHAGQQVRRLREKAVRRAAECVLTTPTEFRNYTDFYASVHHARNVGMMFRPENPLLPNYKHVPIGYHGRASSIVASGTPIVRPKGQTNTENAASPVFGPCKRLDYEMEVGCVVGAGNRLGDPIGEDELEEALFGLCLVNDWSARDVQSWEYQPLGPFLAKNFATTVSPFVVTLDALDPFRCAGPARGADDPLPLPYLRLAGDWGFAVTLEVGIQTAAMRKAGVPHAVVSRGSFTDMYWTLAQMVTHHTVNGCNLLPGDLLASGTVSGPSPESRGCLLEMTWQGLGADGKALPRKAVELPGGEKRMFLEDGDSVRMRGWCERPGFRRIGFGVCEGTVEAARP